MYTVSPRRYYYKLTSYELPAFGSDKQASEAAQNNRMAELSQDGWEPTMMTSVAREVFLLWRKSETYVNK